VTGFINLSSPWTRTVVKELASTPMYTTTTSNYSSLNSRKGLISNIATGRSHGLSMIKVVEISNVRIGKDPHS